jgi:O-palmitoleoyl-L-serine hydrolase
MPGLLSTSSSLLWRRLGRRSAAFALALLAAALLFTFFRYAAVPSASPSPSPTYGHRLPTLVDLTLVYDRDALCLDGTPPGYHFLPGFGDGSHSWLLHLEVLLFLSLLSFFRRNTQTQTQKNLIPPGRELVPQLQILRSA